MLSSHVDVAMLILMTECLAQGLMFTAITYVGGYLTLVLVAVCLGTSFCSISMLRNQNALIMAINSPQVMQPAHAACGLYYLAELAEEYTSAMRRIMYFSIMVSMRAWESADISNITRM